MSILATFFAQHQFCFSIEHIDNTSLSPLSMAALADYPTCIAIADRVHTDQDPAPLDIVHASQLRHALLHYSGKDRDISHLKQFLQHAAKQQLFDVLMLSGDKLKQHNFGHTHPLQRTRYLESINSVQCAKQLDKRFHIGVAFNPFKYTESEKQAQYLKLDKKILAGADFIITQLGFDLEKLTEIQSFLQQHDKQIPVMACVMPLTYPRANYIVKQRIAGIVITPYLLEFLKKEHIHDAQQAEQKAYQRAALQCLICEHLGFAGIHLSSCNQIEQLKKLEQALQQFKHLNLAECWQHYLELFALHDSQALQPSPIAIKQVPLRYIFKYYVMAYLHDVIFASKWATSFGKWLFRFSFWQKPIAERSLLFIEHSTKHLAVGCESCGQCRLAETLYICPETCPKGLANGPCGGTSLDWCEFNDRECIHSQKYRIAKQTQQLNLLRQHLIPTVPLTSRARSSWIKWFN